MARRPPRRISAAYLARVTGFYLERYTTTSRHLKRLLMKRVRRAAAHHGDDVEAGEALVDAEVARLQRMGALNDAAFAASRARSLHRKGKGERAIRSALHAKGLTGAEVDQALERLREEVGDPEWEAARIWARKRRLGPWARQPLDDADQRRKVLAKFGRAGFSYDIARRILALQDP